MHRIFETKFPPTEDTGLSEGENVTLTVPPDSVFEGEIDI